MWITNLTVTGLNNNTRYYFVVQEQTDPHYNNQNIVISDYSQEATGVTVFDGDHDGMSNDWEILYFENISRDGSGDYDSDGLIDVNEYKIGTNPKLKDTDSDDIPDGDEDKNRNGIVDSGETDPARADTDGDEISDGIEDANHNGRVDSGETNPLNSDTDNDGMPDGWEVQYDLDPLYNDANEDEDEDGYSNLKEFKRKTIPNDFNSQPSKGMPWLPLLLGE